MNSAPHLLIEDRPEFERVLDEALRTANRHPDLTTIGQRLSAQQLRSMALSASAAISACAATEYQDFVATRDKLREPTPPREPAPLSLRPEEGDAEADDSRDDSGDTVGLTAAIGGASGAGLVAVLAVLAPVLAGAAAMIFLVVGYALRVIRPAPSIAQPMITAGWLFAALTAAGILIGAVLLLLTALRNGSSAIRGVARDEQREEVSRAREAWRQALLERGMLPFLREALADPDAGPASPPAPASPSSPAAPSSSYVPTRSDAAGRTPHLGYSRPGFSTEGDSPKTRPHFSSPDFSSPEYGGSERD